MDTSKIYILMAEKAVEVQELWEPIAGDVHTGYKWREIYILNNADEDDEFNICGLKPNIWLPRQDQLQGMVIDKYVPKYGFNGFTGWFHDFAKEFEYMDNGNDKRFTSMEQLWLAFVVAELYQKHWDGKDWK